MDENTKGWVKITRWVARIWSLGPILFALVEVLFPHAEENVPVPWTDWMMLGLLFLSVFGLAMAWRWERLGGWVSLVSLAVLTTLFLINIERAFPAVLIFLVGIGVPAVLFLISYYASADRELTI
jgi:hypothetical protein